MNEVLNENQHNENGLRHGYWEECYRNGNLYSKGNYNNGERYGYWEVYWFNVNKYETYYL